MGRRVIYDVTCWTSFTINFPTPFPLFPRALFYPLPPHASPPLLSLPSSPPFTYPSLPPFEVRYFPIPLVKDNTTKPELSRGHKNTHASLSFLPFLPTRMHIFSFHREIMIYEHVNEGDKEEMIMKGRNG